MYDLYRKIILISSIPWVVEHVMMSMMVPESQIKMAKSAIFFKWRKFVQFEIVKSIEKQYEVADIEVAPQTPYISYTKLTRASIWGNSLTGNKVGYEQHNIKKGSTFNPANVVKIPNKNLSQL